MFCLCFPVTIGLGDRLSSVPNDRDIVFVYDPQGNKGKTWFAKWFCKKHSDAQYLEPSKKADMAFCLQDDLRVLFVNVTRSQAEHSEYLYAFLESVKDGMVFSPKYESRMKILKPCHVVVMLNSYPKTELLSRDRVVIIEI